MKKFILIGILTALVTTVIFGEEAGVEVVGPRWLEMRELTKKAVIKNYVVHDATLDEAIEKLASLKEEDFMSGFIEMGFTIGHVENSEVRFSVNENKVTYYNLLKLICEKFKVNFRFDEFSIKVNNKFPDSYKLVSVKCNQIFSIKTGLKTFHKDGPINQIFFDEKNLILTMTGPKKELESFISVLYLNNFVIMESVSWGVPE